MTPHDEYVARIVAKAPPLSSNQISVIEAAFAGFREDLKPKKKKRINPQHEAIKRLSEGLDNV